MTDTPDWSHMSHELKHRFAYHPPTSDKVADMHRAIRQEMELGADLFDAMLPDGREKALAITKLEEAGRGM